MKRSKWVRLIAVILIISMLAAPVSAAPFRGNDGVRTNGVVGIIVEIIRDIIRDIFDDWFDEPGEEEPVPTNPITPTTPTPTQPGETEPGETEPTTPGETEPGETKPTTPGETEPGETKPTQPGETEPDETEPTQPGVTEPDETEPTTPDETEPEVEAPKMELNLVEGHSNTVNGNLLRAVTYTLGQTIAQQNEPLRTTGSQKSPALSSPFGKQSNTQTAPYALRSNGLSTFAAAPSVQPMAETVTTISETPLVITADNPVIPNGKYVIHHNNADYGKYMTNNTRDVTQWEGTTVLLGISDKAAATHFTFTRQADGTYAIQGPAGNYMNIERNKGNIITSPNYFSLEIQSDGIWLRDTNSNDCINVLGNDEFNGEYFGGWASGSPLELYEVITTTVPEQIELNLSVTARYMTNRLSWNAVSGVTYTIQRSTDNSTWSTLGTATTGSYLDTSAGKGTQYFYRVLDGVDYTLGVQGVPTGMNALKKIAVLFYEGSDKTTFNGSNKEVIASGEKAAELTALKSGTIIYKANFENLTGVQAVLGTNTGCYVGSSGDRFRHESGGSFKGSFNDGTLTTGKNSAGLIYDDTNGHWALCSNGDNVYTADLDEANFDMMTATSANTYYAGGSSNNNHSFRGTINYIMILSEVLTDFELRALTAVNADHDAEDTEEPLELVYFPVTMFNYDTNAMNIATHIQDLAWARDTETELTEWKGLYFSDGTPAAGYNGPTGEYTDGWSVTYELVTPTIEGESMTNLDTTSDYILVNKRSGYAVALGDCQRVTSNQSGNKANLHLVDSPDLGLGIGLTAAPATITMSYSAENADSSFIWNYYTDGTYRYFKHGNGEYMDYTTTSSGTRSDSRNQNRLRFYSVNGDANAVLIRQQNNTYLSDFGGHDGDFYCAYSNTDDDGNPFYIYRRLSPEQVQVPITGSFTQGYAAHNSWHKNTDGTDRKANGDLFYTGLAGDFLKSNGDIMFTVPDGGIFSFDRSKLSEENDYFDGVKNVYEFVGMPFVVDDSYGYYKYTFDSDKNGVYFEDTNNDGTPDPAPGTATQYNKLRVDLGVAQRLPNDLSVGDGSRNGWFPYNINTANKNNLVYHFGMRADLPFSMTSNGRIKETDDSSAPIEFTFSGDDDVWIYIDGRLVVDLGGIHNRFDITIDFAANTIVYSEENDADTNSETGSFNDPNFATTQKLFNENGVEGLLGITRQEFAISTDHTMQFFYLERGAGTSNCRIEFNLPMIDSVLVTKEATKSWSAQLQEADEKAENGGDGTRDLTPGEQEAVNNLLFGFTLYKMEGSYFDENGEPIEDAKFTPIANTRYFILDASGQVVGNGDTDANGHFYLRNGQTAKFMTDMPRDGVTYYLVEDQLPEGFLTPDYKYAGTTAHGYEYTGIQMDPDTGAHVDVPRTEVSDAADMGEHELPMDATENKSYIITAKGSVQATDTLQFVCINYLEHNTDPVRAIANEDIIVIDHGLPVQIDPLVNDIIRGENILNTEIVAVVAGDHDFDLNDNDSITADEVTELIKPEGGEHLSFTGHSGTFILYPASEDHVPTHESFTYTLNKQLTEVEVLTYLIKSTARVSEYEGGETVSVYSQAKLYVVPATIMYYEENFNDLVKFSNGSGEFTPELMVNDSFVSPYQEPGVVGTVEDSTYGSDVAYLHDSEDSNGTSYFFDTSNGWVRFQYTFTGTGTTFFARTSATTGYMQVLLFKGEQVVAGKQLDTYYRDTYFYKDDQDYKKSHDDEPLYNIPVYTNDDLQYDTYTVVVTVATKGTKAAGPMNPEANNMKYSMHEFYLDGIRVMQPLNGVFTTDEDSGECVPIPTDELAPITQKALGAYATDGESNLDVATLRHKILEEFTPEYDEESDEEPDWPFVVLTDTNKQIVKASEYASAGPKEEVYLSAADTASGITNAQSVSFSLKLWEPDGLKLYMGMKAPFGRASVMVGSHLHELNNATDYYFDVTNDFASRITKYEQLCDDSGQPLYTDPSGERVYESFADGAFHYVENDDIVEEDIELTPVDDLSQPYIVVTYTFEAVEGIVSLTNIKVVGSYQFTILENEDITVDGGGDEGGEDFEEEVNE